MNSGMLVREAQHQEQSIGNDAGTHISAVHWDTKDTKDGKRANCLERRNDEEETGNKKT